MNTTLWILALALLVYILTCVHQWRRLTKGSPEPPPNQSSEKMSRRDEPASSVNNH